LRPGDLVMAKPIPPHPSHRDGLLGVLVRVVTPPPLVGEVLPRRYFEVMTSIGLRDYYENEVSPLFPESSIIEAPQ
jgi:hypothetical protein